ncbi:MAG TPA: hypothetical protein VFQ53_29870 [Kofleriaceae bacterium]|nr:hypothetical protein [Kofleriaceae bacterium]
MTDLLEAATAALRASGDDDDATPLAHATRIRLRHSLEVRAHDHHRTVRIGAVLAVLLVTSAAWAWSTGKLHRVLAPFRHTSVEAPAPATIDPPAFDPPARRIATAPDREAIAWPAPVRVDEPPAPATTRIAKRSPAPIEVLYRKAHDLHFHGTDPAAALAAWDAYLAAEPHGRFEREARYNRALVLVKLRRFTEARDALAPFARGELAYRQDAAVQIVDRLDAILAQERSR